MPTLGLSKAGLEQLHEVMAGHVSAGRVPGLVLALSRGGDVYTDAIGTAAVGGSQPIRRDAIFRITSMTRPVTAVATLLLVQDGRLAFDEPVDRLLPELAGRRVLRRTDGPLDDTVAADRPVTTADLLTFRSGFGMILAPPSEYPILEAEQALELRSVGPPTPVTPHGPDEWLRRMGTLPLMDQPGGQWRYNTSSQILGVLIARAAGQPVESFYNERIFGPLGMTDTGFRVPESELHRLVPCYQEAAGGLVPYDDDGQWARPRVFADCGAGLVSTVSDYLVFGQMLLAGGTHRGARILAPELVAAMTADHLTPEQRDTAGPILGGRGWGFGLSIIDPPGGAGTGPKGYGWNGGFGTAWVNDPAEDLVAILCTQVLAAPGSSGVESDFWSALVLWRPSRLWLWLGMAGNALIIAVYVASRTVGLPIGPDVSNPEPVGGLDVVSVILEVALIAGCAALLWRPSLADRPVRRRGSFGTIAGLVAVPAVVIAATTAVMTPGWAGPEGPAGMAPGSPAASGSSSMPGMGTIAGHPEMKMYGSTAPPTAAQVIAAGQLIKETDSSLARYQKVQAAFAAGYTYVLRTNGEEHLLYDGGNPAYAGLHPQYPSSLVYATNVPHHAPILLGAMYIESDRTNGPQVGGSLTRWHSHLVVCQGGKPTIAGFGVQLRGACNPSTWTDRYTAQMLHVWVVPYPGGAFSDDLSQAATNAAVRAVLSHK